MESHHQRINPKISNVENQSVMRCNQSDHFPFELEVPETQTEPVSTKLSEFPSPYHIQHNILSGISKCPTYHTEHIRVLNLPIHVSLGARPTLVRHIWGPELPFSLIPTNYGVYPTLTTTIQYHAYLI